MGWTRVKELPIFAVIFVSTFLVSGAILSFLLLIASVVVWPLSRDRYRQLSYFLIYPSWAQLVFLIDWWAPSEIILYADEMAQEAIGKEHALVIMNHSYDVDWLAGWLVCERSGLLAATKVFAKRSLSYVPVIGWIWRMAEIIFLDRNWQTDKSCIVNQIHQISQYKNPVWILLFPEGTRYTEAKHKASVEFAKAGGLPYLKHLLTPRTKGFTLTMLAIKESGYKIKVIYDVTIGFESGPDINEPTLMNLIRGKPVKAHVDVVRIPSENVPTTEEEAAHWLHKIFERKDHLLDEFMRKNRFEGRSYKLPRRPYSLINEIIWIFIVVGGLLYYCLVVSSYIPWWFLPLLAILLSIALHYLANVTVTSKGSSYGQGKNRRTEGRILNADTGGVKED